MKQLLFFLTCLFTFSATQAQSPAFNELRRQIALARPDAELENKLIAFTKCELQEEKSRSEFIRVQNVYEHAILQGGRKGILVVYIAGDNVTITDLPANSIVAHAPDCENILASGLSNGVYNQEGKLVYSNLQAGEVFNAIKKLITR